MSRKVLVLNADYSALSICSVAKAFGLVFLNKAELIAPSEQGFLRTIDKKYPYPSIIRLRHYVQVPYKSVVLNRQNVFKRDRNACQYCGSSQELTLDHLIPKARGGKTTWENLVTACRRCNAKKGHFTPEESNMKPQQKPFKPTFVVFLRDFSGTLEASWIPFLGAK